MQKPSVPIPGILENAEIEIAETSSDIPPALGSNLGDKGMITLAREHNAQMGAGNAASSSINETKAYGLEDQPDFLNRSEVEQADAQASSLQITRN